MHPDCLAPFSVCVGFLLLEVYLVFLLHVFQGWRVWRVCLCSLNGCAFGVP
jgi:hypothetical protein